MGLAVDLRRVCGGRIHHWRCHQLVTLEAIYLCGFAFTLGLGLGMGPANPARRFDSFRYVVIVALVWPVAGVVLFAEWLKQNGVI